MTAASRVIPPRPAATAVSARAIGTNAATTVPNAMTRMTRAATNPMASAPDVSVSALMKIASPPSSAARSALRAGPTAASRAASGAGPRSTDGVSKVMVANPIRPSSDTVLSTNGSETATTWSTARIRRRASAITSRWANSGWPSSAANTAMALPPAASGKRSASSWLARSLWLPGAVMSSTNAPPIDPAVARTTMIPISQAAMVTHGRRALASPMRRASWYTVESFSIGGASCGCRGRHVEVDPPPARCARRPLRERFVPRPREGPSVRCAGPVSSLRRAAVSIQGRVLRARRSPTVSG